MVDADRALGAIVAIAVAVFALAFPFVASGYHIYQGAQVLILAIALLGLNLLTGFNGQISLGHGAFFAIGGYGAAILMVKFGLPYWLAIPLASVVCFIAGFLFGFPALRFGGLYLALATFALAVAAPQILSYKGFDFLTGGSQGLTLAKPPVPFGLRLTADQWLYLVCLACAAALYWAARNLVRGRIGRALVAIRDQPIAAETMGINAALYKTTCFGVSALYAGVAGGLSALAVGFVSPESFGLALSLAFLVGIVVGGLASLGGALFGALFIEFVPNLADQLTVSFGESAKALPGAIYGALLILVMAVLPTGGAGAARAAMKAVARLIASPGRAQIETDDGRRDRREIHREGRIHMISRRSFLQSSAAAAAFAAGTRAARADNPPGVTDTEIKIGQTMPYSGPASAYGVIGKADLAYFKMINEQGGVNGRKINLISLDDGYSPPKTVEQTRRLVEQEQVAFLFNRLGTACCASVRQYMNDNKIPQLFVATGASMFSDPEHFPWTMGWQPNYQTEAAIFGKHIVATKPDAKIGVLYQNDGFGKDYLIGLKRGLGPDHAGMVIKEVSYETSEPTVDSQIVTLAGRGRRYGALCGDAEIRGAGDPQDLRPRLDAGPLRDRRLAVDRNRDEACGAREVEGRDHRHLRQGPDRRALEGRPRATRRSQTSSAST